MSIIFFLLRTMQKFKFEHFHRNFQSCQGLENSDFYSLLVKNPIFFCFWTGVSPKVRVGRI